MGVTKIFLKDGCMEKIQVKFRILHAIKLQAWARGRRAQRKYKRFRMALIVLQGKYKAILTKRKFQSFSKQLIRLQVRPCVCVPVCACMCVSLSVCVLLRPTFGVAVLCEGTGG